MMATTTRGELAGIAKAFPFCHIIAVVSFLATLVLWLMHPSPWPYLLTFGLISIVWFGLIAWMWRMRRFITTLLAMAVFGLTYQVPVSIFERLYADELSESQLWQPLLLALSIIAVLFYTFRTWVVSYARLHTNTEPADAPNERPA
ncbi:MAG: hypothetical protein IH623_21370 [Verrucomicrobia bacterium]|nr:hypothetical protein [Verrucomicrobiota bacterium]